MLKEGKLKENQFEKTELTCTQNVSTTDFVTKIELLESRCLGIFVSNVRFLHFCQVLQYYGHQ